MEFVDLTEEEFMIFSKKYKQTSFFQTVYWANIKKKNGWQSHYVGLKENNEVIAASLLLSKKIKFFKTMYYAPRGFLLDYNNFEILEKFTDGIKKFLKEHNALFLKINPYLDYQKRDVDGNVIPNTARDDIMDCFKKLGYVHNGFYIEQEKKKDLEPRWISSLNINNMSIDELFKNMRSGTKYGINNSRKNCLKIIEADESNLIEFKNLMKHTAERREFIDRPLSYYENMFKVLNKENLVKVLLIEINFVDLLNHYNDEVKNFNLKIENLKGKKRKEGQIKELESERNSITKKINSLKDTINEYGNKKIIAGGWYMLYGNEIIYLFGASYKDFMKYNSQYLLQYEMIKYAVDNNYDAFNFYGIDGNFDSSSKGFGLFDFKRGFNACVHELVGEFDLIISLPMYKIYNVSFQIYKLVKSLLNKK